MNADETVAPAAKFGDCGSAGVHRFARYAMACEFEFFLCSPDARYAERASDAAFREIERLEQELSRFVPTGDVARINRLRAGESCVVSADTAACLRTAAEVNAATRGAFDVCFARRAELGTAYPAGALEPLLVNFSARRVASPAGNPRVDLGAIGKGFALDRAVEVLREWKIVAALLHAGQSSALPIGRMPDGRPWSVALREPASQAETLAEVALSDRALSGSGRRLHGEHIRQPRTGGLPLHVAAWAAARSAAESDAFSTAFMLLSGEEIRRICGAYPQLNAWWLDEGGTLHTAAT